MILGVSVDMDDPLNRGLARLLVSIWEGVTGSVSLLFVVSFFFFRFIEIGSLTDFSACKFHSRYTREIG